MGLARAIHPTAAATLTGALVFMAAPVARADQVREDQWALQAFDTEAIWKISEGKGITVAVIDAGADAQHVDLTGQVIQGKDFINGGSPDPSPEQDHGTGMASIIAGHGHGQGNSDGVMGLAPEAKVLNIRDDGHHADGFASSIRYAVDHGASVINISQGSSDPQNESGEEAAIAYALKKNVLVVAPSGNEGGSVGYPAAYPGVLAVGGVQNNGEIWPDSGIGPQVLLTAPATHIVSAGGTTHISYRAGTGTSDATAYVSAAAALLRARFPNLTPGQIVNRLVKTAGLPASAKGISLPDERYGYGFIQPLAALTRNIPTGSEYGPLTVPASLKQSTGAATANGTGGAASSSTSSNTLKRAALFAILGLLALLVVGAAVFVIARITRRRNGADSSPGGYVAGQPPYGQPPHQQQPQENDYQAGHPSPTHPQQQQQPRSWNNQ